MNYGKALEELEGIVKDYLEKTELTEVQKIDMLGDLMESCRELRREMILSIEQYRED